MADFKVQFLFSLGRYGWSETYYCTTSNHTETEKKARELARIRAEGLAESVYIEAIRISDEDIKGDALLVPVQLGRRTAATSGKPPDVPQTSWYMRIQSANLYRRQLHIRGIPDEWTEAVTDFVTAGSAWAPADSLLKFATKYGAYLVANEWKMKVNERGAGNEPRQIANAVRNPESGVWTITAAVADWPVTGKCRVSRLPGLEALWGIQKYTATAANTIRIAPSLNAGEWFNGGEITLQKNIYVDIDSAVLQRVSNRKTGRPFFLTRGRSPNRKATT